MAEVQLATLTIPQTIHDAIIAHAREGKPEEICGLLRGREGQVTGLLRARNAAANPITDYEVEAQALLAQFEWEDEGDSLTAIYHSHPEDPAYPSASDAINAYYPDSVYLICSLQDDTQPVIRGFKLVETTGAFDLAAARTALSFYETRPGRWACYVAPDADTLAVFGELTRPAGQAMYVVAETDAEDGDYTRAVTVEPVEIIIAS